MKYTKVAFILLELHKKNINKLEKKTICNY